MVIQKKFSIALLGCALMVASCSDDSEVKGQAAAAIGESEKEKSSSKTCGEKSLALADTYTYHSPEVQGQLGFCGGCHSGPGSSADIDFTDYDRMLTTFSNEGIDLARMVSQVESNHQGSKSTEALAIFNGWAGTSFTRGTPNGMNDESPFYDENNGDDPLDLDGFDPFGSDEAAPDAAECP